MASPSVQIAGSGATVASTFEAHPDYTEAAPDWTLMFDVYKGERRIKSKTTTYLPATGGMRALGLGNGANGEPKEGQALYNSYIARARFPDWYRSTVVKLLGLMTREAAVIELPGRLEELEKNATPQGEPIQMLLAKIFEHQLRFGRFGIMVDVDESRNLPYFATYHALSIVNWDDVIERQEANDISRRLEFTLLDESRYERSPLTGAEGTTLANRSWQWVNRARILYMEDGRYKVRTERQNVIDQTIEPSLRGRYLDQIPFVFVNAMDNLPDPDEPPLVGLASIALQAYRTDADYRQALFNQGQDTLVIRGGSMPNSDPRDSGAGENPSGQQIVGAGAAIIVPENGDAKFIGVESSGLSELRQALNDSKAEAGEYGGELLSAAGGGESGEALATRIGARTANVPGIVKTGAAALEKALRIAAEWLGENPDDVKVEPNMDFIEDAMKGEEASAWIGAKQLGFPISYRTLHEMAQRRDATERSFEEELEEIDRERGMMDRDEGGFRGGDPGEGAGNPDDDIGDDDDQGGEDGRQPPQQ